MAVTDSSPSATPVEEPCIQLLSDSLINKIAAGEVIERPASVVKELLENSVDAGATRVEVRIEDGGRSLISVLDDGLGMSRTDALMSLERHATSKLRDEGDLFRIDSLGFRGEALPSIAEVSRFELLTGTDGAEVGTRLVLDGGVWGEIEDAPNPGGTEIRVRRLFFNTPVRLKFLKTPRTEMHHVLDTVQRVALSRPNIALRLVADGRSVIDVARDDTLLDRVRRVLGKAVSRGLHPIAAERDGFRLEGLVSGPALHRSNRSALFFFVNGRFVRDRTVVGAFLAAYRDLLPRGRYPVAVLFLDLPAEDVDVNVHPTKVEVRFRDPSEVWRFIGGTLSEFLERLVDGPEVQGDLPGTPGAGPGPQPSAPIPDSDGLAGSRPSPPPASPWPVAAEPRRSFAPREGLAARAMQRAVPGASVEAVADAVASAKPGPVLLDPLAAGERPGPLPAAPVRAWPWAERLERREAAGLAWGAGGRRPRLSRGELRGRFADRWILWEAGDELLLVDPVAAHRRLLFANLQQGSATGRLESRRLLVPELIEREEESVAGLLAQQDSLVRRGLELSDFGGGTLAVHAGPVGLASARIGGALTVLLDRLGEEKGLTGADFDYELDALLAWFGAIAPVEQLDRDAMEVLVVQLDTVERAFACPHGQPVLARLPREEVERWFQPKP